MSTTDERKAINRVRKLMQVTTDRGYSETEALAAAKAITDLLTEHELSIENIGEATSEEMLANRVYNATHPVRQCGNAIADLTGTRFYWQGPIAVFFGFKGDTEIAHGLFKMLRNAMDYEWKKYRDSNEGQLLQRIGHKVLRMRTSFLKAMAARIASRIWAMADAKQAAVKSGSATGTALVIQEQKLAQVDEARKAMFAEARMSEPVPDKSKLDLAKMSVVAAKAGYQAGDRVGIGGITEGAGNVPRLEEEKS